MIGAYIDDGSVTLNRLRRATGQVFLILENPAFQPIEAPCAAGRPVYSTVTRAAS